MRSNPPDDRILWICSKIINNLRKDKKRVDVFSLKISVYCCALFGQLIWFETLLEIHDMCCEFFVSSM